MKNALKTVVTIGAAALLAVISNYYVAGWYNIIPWSIAALIIGYANSTRRKSIIRGAVFGYVLFLTYIFLGYKGKTDTSDYSHFVLFDVLFSLAGAVAGTIGAVAGNWMGAKFVG